MKKTEPDSNSQKFFFTLFILLFYLQLTGQNTVFQQIELPSEITTINALLPENENIIWIATDKGLYSYDGAVFKRFYEDSKPDFYQINSVAKDISNNIWFGTYNGYLVKFANMQVIQSFDIKSYCKTDNYLITSVSICTETRCNKPEILLTTSGGEIFSVDTITKKIIAIDSPAEGTIYSVQYGYHPTIWLCSSDGFYTMNKNEKWKKKPGLYTAYGIFENEGKFWAIGRNEGKQAILMLYYDESLNGNQKHFVWKDLDLSRIADIYTRFYEVAFTEGEIAWITSQSGLIRYNPINATAKHYDKYKNINIKDINHITTQKNNLIWISSSGRRLIRVELN